MRRMNLKSSTRAAIGAASILVLSGAGPGCAAKTTPPSAPDRTGLVAQPCAGLELGSGPLDPSNARVFVEIAEVSARDLPRPIGRWLDENAVEIRSSANLVAFPNVPTSMPWGQCVDSICASMKRALTLTAALPQTASEPIGIALRIEDSSHEGGAANPRVLLDTTLQAQNQEPLVLPPAPELSSGSVVVTAYLLRRHDDLHRLLTCKEQQREREQAPR
jgi:hypothetical protein